MKLTSFCLTAIILSFSSIVSADDLDLVKEARAKFADCMMKYDESGNTKFDARVDDCKRQSKTNFAGKYSNVEYFFKNPIEDGKIGAHISGNIISVMVIASVSTKNSKGKIISTTRTPDLPIYGFNIAPGDKPCDCNFDHKSSYENLTDSQMRNAVMADLQCTYGKEKDASGQCVKTCKEFGSFYVGGNNPKSQCRNCEDLYNKNFKAAFEARGRPKPTLFASQPENNFCFDEHDCTFQQKWNSQKSKCEPDCGVGRHLDDNPLYPSCELDDDFCDQKYKYIMAMAKMDEPSWIYKLSAVGCNYKPMLSDIKKEFLQGMDAKLKECHENRKNRNLDPVFMQLFSVITYCAEELDLTPTELLKNAGISAEEYQDSYPQVPTESIPLSRSMYMGGASLGYPTGPANFQFSGDPSSTR